MRSFEEGRKESASKTDIPGKAGWKGGCKQNTKNREALPAMVQAQDRYSAVEQQMGG